MRFNRRDGKFFLLQTLVNNHQSHLNHVEPCYPPRSQVFQFIFFFSLRQPLEMKTVEM